ncbi:hypothetical protein L2745_18805, partial [Shewanella xiamenensis]
VVIFIGGPVLFLMSFSDYIVAHCEADLKWMGPFHYPCHRGIRESIHIRQAALHPRMDSLRIFEQMHSLLSVGAACLPVTQKFSLFLSQRIPSF